MSGKSSVAITIFMAFFLSSCEPGLEVSPASAGESLPAPAFRVSDSESAQPRFNTIVLLKQDGKIIWHVRSKPLAAQTSIVEFRYGEEPSGFETVIPPEPLQRGVDYTLHVTGIAHGAFRFRVDSGDRLRPLH